MSKYPGFFVTIEGIEGVGKTTILSYIKTLLENKKIPFVVSREPGGTEIAEAIRKVLLGHYSEAMTHDTELLLMFAGRAQNIQQVILPALQEGKWVISDRFTDASFAYQGGGRGVSFQRIEQLAQWVHKDLTPDLTILLDIDPEIGLQRVTSRGAKDRIEVETIHFFHKVRASYLQLAKENNRRFCVIEANQSLDLIKQAIDKIFVTII